MATPSTSAAELGIAAAAATIATTGVGVGYGLEAAAITAVAICAAASLTANVAVVAHRLTGGPVRPLTRNVGLSETVLREVEAIYRTVSDLGYARLTDLVSLGVDLATAKRLIVAARGLAPLPA